MKKERFKYNVGTSHGKNPEYRDGFLVSLSCALPSDKAHNELYKNIISKIGHTVTPGNILRVTGISEAE